MAIPAWVPPRIPITLSSWCDYPQTWGSLGRILAWTLFFLWVLGQLLPEPPENIPDARSKPHPSVRTMLTRESDPHWVRAADKESPGEEVVAWISDSSTQIKRSSPSDEESFAYLPEYVWHWLQEQAFSRGIVGKTRIDLYLRTRRRPLDILALVDHAVSSPAGMVVLNLNMAWDFNDAALFFTENVFIGNSVFWTKEIFVSPWLGLVLQPRHLVGGAVNKLLPAIGNGAHYQKMWQLDRLRWRREEAKPGGLQASTEGVPSPLSFKQPLQFWLYHRFHMIDASDPASGHNAKKWQMGGMLLSRHVSGERSERLLHRALSLLRASGKRVFVYPTPLAPEAMAEGELIPILARNCALLDDLRTQYASPGIEIAPCLPPGAFEGMVFVDYMHIKDPGKSWPRYLGERILAGMSRREELP